MKSPVRRAAARAVEKDADGMFNPMSWLDLELVDNPHPFAYGDGLITD